MGEPNLDLGILYTGGIEKPQASEKGFYPRVIVDAYGGPNFAYQQVDFERRVFYSQVGGQLTGTLTKTSMLDTYALPPGFVGPNARLKVRVLGEAPARIGTKIGVDFFGNALSTPMDLTTVAALPPSATTPFVYECIIYPALSTQRSEGSLLVSTLAPIVNTSLTAANPQTEQMIRVMGQLANVADTLTLRRVEVWLLG